MPQPLRGGWTPCGNGRQRVAVAEPAGTAGGPHHVFDEYVLAVHRRRIARSQCLQRDYRLIGAVLADQHDEWAIARHSLSDSFNTRQHAAMAAPFGAIDEG